MTHRRRNIISIIHTRELRYDIIDDSKCHYQTVQYIVVKSDSDISDPEVFDSIVELYVPLGFMDNKDMLMPLARIMLKWATTEHFAVLSNPARDSILKHLVLMYAFWLKHPLMRDSFFSQNVMDAIWIFMKSGRRL